jgi:membrane protease YdiL (CAAX protease family)
MKNPLWNPEQRRLRTLWRLLVQGLLFFAGILAVGAAARAVAMLWLLLRGGEAIVALPLVQLLAVVGVVGAAFLSVWLAGRLLDRRHFADFGFDLSRGWWLDLGFGLALGAVLMAGIFLAQRAVGWVIVTGTLQSPGPGEPFAVGIVVALAFFIGVGVYEELLFRGYQLHNLAEGLNLRAVGARGAVVLAWLLSSAVFGLLHAMNPNATVLSTANIALAGLFLGLGYVLTGELAIPIGLHITWNFFQGNVFGFPVSGLRAGATLIAVAQAGPELWTGGAFGPEGGLVGVAAMLVGSGLIVAWVRRRYGRVALQGRLATPPRAEGS